MPSHYSAARTREEYLSEDLSIAKLWRLYKELNHENQELREVSEKVYRDVSDLILIALFYHVGQFDDFRITNNQKYITTYSKYITKIYGKIKQ